MESQQRYPLAWPAGWKRTPRHDRKAARFESQSKSYRAPSVPGAQGYYSTSRNRLTVYQAVGRLSSEMRRLGVLDGDWLISSNLKVRLDGMPYSNAAEPDDSGVAVYFRIGSQRQPRVLACDRWNRVADNIAAIAAHVEAMRAQDRYGVGTLEQAFAGYAAIPEKTDGSDWRAELGFKVDEAVTREQAEARYRELARQRHPDAGGSHEAMARLNRARVSASKELVS